jgi:phosphatidylserine/phosphatidylglycerophosphate/cardiolipin synthase-like enzyme
MDSAIAQKSGADSIARINALTMRSIKGLRSEPKIGSKAVLNIIAHTAGSVHSKLVVVGNDSEAIGFTGGLDFEEQRWAHPSHPGRETWHDVAAKIEGPASQALYDLFRNMWQENISRPAKRFKFEGQEMPSFLPGTPVLSARILPTTPKSTHHVQSLRTVPTFNYRWYNCLPENKPISFAQSGIFEFKAAIRKAISNAQTFIYMEDQSFWSQEILSWVSHAIQETPGLRVILLTSGRADPNDPAFPDAILSNSINHGLLEDLSAGQRDQVRMYKRMGDIVRLESVDITDIENDGATSRVTTNTLALKRVPQNIFARDRLLLMNGGGNAFKVTGNPEVPENEFKVYNVENLPGGIAPVIGTYELHQHKGITIHSKTILIDDQWTFIGSANIMRRSLYTDLEHGITALDEDEIMAREYRKRLWADHFRHDNPNDFEDIQESLHAWEASWGAVGLAPARPSLLEHITLPIAPDKPLLGADKTKYDKYLDLDSRQEWGGIIP